MGHSHSVLDRCVSGDGGMALGRPKQEDDGDAQASAWRGCRTRPYGLPGKRITGARSSAQVWLALSPITARAFVMNSMSTLTLSGK